MNLKKNELGWSKPNSGSGGSYDDSTIKADIEEINSQLENKPNKDHIWNMDNMGQDVKEAMTGGSVAVVGKNAILNENIVDEQISYNKTDFINVDDTCNLIDKNKFIKDYTILPKNGNLYSATNWYATDYIKVDSSKSYHYYNIDNRNYAFYDKDKNYVSGGGDDALLSNPFTAPANACFIRVCLYGANRLATSYLSTVKNPNDFSYIINNLNLSDNQFQNMFNRINEEIVISERQVDFIKVLEHGNYFSSVGLVADSYIKGQLDGSCASSTDACATDYLPFDENTNYYWFGLYAGYCAFYDKNKHYISGFGIQDATNSLPNPFTTPSGTKYARFTILNSTDVSSIWINSENKIPPEESTYYFDINIAKNSNVNPCDFEDNHYISIFNKIACIGDSLTEGIFNCNDNTFHKNGNYSYPTYLSKLTGVQTVNLGHGGITSKGWYEKYKDSDLSGYDCAIIQLGVNDVAKSEQGVDENATIQYLQLIIDKLKNQNTNIKIFIAGIAKNKNFNSEEYLSRNEAIKIFASNKESEDIFFIDLKQYSIIEDTPYVRGHLTALGYLQQAKEYRNYISYIIFKNIDNFINVQFAGTNYIPY